MKSLTTVIGHTCFSRGSNFFYFRTLFSNAEFYYSSDLPRFLLFSTLSISRIQHSPCLMGFSERKRERERKRKRKRKGERKRKRKRCKIWRIRVKLRWEAAYMKLSKKKYNE